MSNLSSQLRDRRWQKRRLEILSRDDFTCRMCGSTDNTEQLHVHHLVYKRSLPIWDYPGNALITLCATCHTERIEDWQLAMCGFLNSMLLAFPSTTYEEEIDSVAEIARCGSMIDPDDWRAFRAVAMQKPEMFGELVFGGSVYSQAFHKVLDEIQEVIGGRPLGEV